MAIAKHHLLLAVPVVVALLLLAVPSSAAERYRTVYLRFYMHDIDHGRGQTAMKIVRGPGPPIPPDSNIGDMTVIDDVLTDGPNLTSSRAVGRAQGTYVLASMEGPVLLVSVTVALTDGPFIGSTIVIVGRNEVFDEVRELAVVGGTSQFRRASGHVVWKTAGMVANDVVFELNVQATVPIAITSAADRRRYNSPAVESSGSISAVGSSSPDS